MTPPEARETSPNNNIYLGIRPVSLSPDLLEKITALYRQVAERHWWPFLPKVDKIPDLEYVLHTLEERRFFNWQLGSSIEPRTSLRIAKGYIGDPDRELLTFEIWPEGGVYINREAAREYEEMRQVFRTAVNFLLAEEGIGLPVLSKTR